MTPTDYYVKAWTIGIDRPTATTILEEAPSIDDAWQQVIRAALIKAARTTS